MSLQENGRSDGPTAVNGTGNLNGKSSAKKSKRLLAAEEKKLEAEQDAVEPSRATEQHLERCIALNLFSGKSCQIKMHEMNGCSREGIS